MKLNCVQLACKHFPRSSVSWFLFSRAASTAPVQAPSGSFQGEKSLQHLVLNEKRNVLTGTWNGFLPDPFKGKNTLRNNSSLVTEEMMLNAYIAPQSRAETAVKSLNNFWISVMDKMSGFEKAQKSKDIWISKLVLTEMFLANALLMGSMVCHTKSVLNPGRDVFTVSRYLSHADNLRMSFTAVLEMKNPNIFYRLSTVIFQTVDLFLWTTLLFPAPRVAHRMLAYLLEDSLDTYNK